MGCYRQLETRKALGQWQVACDQPATTQRIEALQAWVAALEREM